ncbi:hypothetical protein BJX62DRAFT_207128 [Aspergillus germanicus]
MPTMPQITRLLVEMGSLLCFTYAGFQIFIRASRTNSLNGWKDLCTRQCLWKRSHPPFLYLLSSFPLSFLFLFVSSLCHQPPSQLGSLSIYLPFSPHHDRRHHQQQKQTTILARIFS